MNTAFQVQNERGKGALRTWIRMLSCTTLIERRLRSRLRDEFDITLPQFDVLTELEHAGGPQTMSALSDRLMVSNGNVTGVVDRLEKIGLVMRTLSATDRRVLFIDLTATGRAAFDKMAARHEEWVEEAFAELSTDDLNSLTDLLAKAKRSVKSATGNAE